MHIIGTSARPDLPLAVIAGAGALGMAMARRMAQNYRVLLADLDIARTEANAATMRAEGCDAGGPSPLNVLSRWNRDGWIPATMAPLP